MYRSSYFCALYELSVNNPIKSVRWQGTIFVGNDLTIVLTKLVGATLSELEYMGDLDAAFCRVAMRH